MKYSNLQRAAELAHEITMIENARRALADERVTITIRAADKSILPLPPSVRHNIINVLNLEYNRMREEVEEL